MEAPENVQPSGDENVEAVKDSQIVEPAAESVQEEEGSKYQQLESQLREMSERLQKQSALIGKLTNERKNQESQETDKKEKEPAKTGDVSKYRELEEKLDGFQRRIQKQERAAKISEIELSLVEAGASPQLAKEQAEFFNFKLGDSIVSEETDDGGIVHKWVDTDGAHVPLSHWAKAYIESDAGGYLRAHKVGPSVKNNGSSAKNAQKVKLSSADYSRAYAEAHAQGKEAADAFAAMHTMA